jgi:fatty acid desaturase
MIAHAWAVIIAAGAVFVIWPNPLTYILAVMLIGARQLGLAILMHDAAHGALHPNAKLNDWMAEWLCGSAVGGSLKAAPTADGGFVVTARIPAGRIGAIG